MSCLAEKIDQLRVFPRILLFLAYAFVFYYIQTITLAYIDSPNKSTEFTAFVTVTIPAVVGIVTNLTNKYFDTGTSWEEKK